MTSTNVKWMWNGSDNPWAELPDVKWIPYTPNENELIENAFRNQKSKVELENYELDLINHVQIHKNNRHSQRQIYRHELHDHKFLTEPLHPKQAVQFSYASCYSLFILECQRLKIVTVKQLKNSSTRRMVVERAAEGIINEGYNAGQEDVAKEMVSELLEKKSSSLDEIYKCVIHLYTMDNFLYKLTNETLRLAEDNLPLEQQYDWTNKLHTLGPFALILDCALSYYCTRKSMCVYRTAKLSEEQIEQFREMRFLECAYFPAFTSCSRSKEWANLFEGNVFFIIEVPKRILSILPRQGLTDVREFSAFPHEEEVLMRPSTLFHVNSVELNRGTNQHEIKLTIV
jgi:hypothetical protein